MKKKSWNQNLVVFALSMVVVMMSITTHQAAAELGDVKSMGKVTGTPDLVMNGCFGRSVAGIGDLDGDGVKDIAAGAHRDNDGAYEAGAVYVLFLNTNGTVRSQQKISKTSGNGPDILGVGDRFGTSVAGIGDLDGDGVRDIAAGAPYDDDGTTNAGAVYVLFLNTDGTVKTNQKISATSGGGPTNLAASDFFGGSAASIGDLDGDGVEDIAAGAYGDVEGAVYVMFMNTNGTVKSYQKISDTNGVPDLGAGGWFGFSVAGIGDLDGDGVEDIAAGARYDDDGGTDVGAVYVLFLNTNGTVKSYQKITEGSGGGPTLDGSDQFGFSVAGIGDLDGDGIEDIAADAFGDNDGGSGAGAVYVMFMNTNGTVKSYQKITEGSGGGPTLDAYDYFGCSVASIGDLNGDGVEDIAAGAYGDDDGDSSAGAVYVLLMNTNGTVKSYQKISETSGPGPDLDAGDYFGCSVAGIGDLDGDGVPDIAAGALYDDDGAAGAVYVLFMNTDGWLKTYQKISETKGNGPDLDGDDRFGVSVAAIGDLDGDGIEDIVAGAYCDDDGGVNAGAVYVLFMNTNGMVKSYQKISETSGAGGPVLDAADFFGVSVAGIGDLDGDGVEDIAAGAYGDDDGGSMAGAVYVLFMNTNGTAKSYQKITEGTGGGPTLDANDNFGWSVAQIGDLDGDGVGDIAAGAYGDDDGATDAGAVYVLFMNTNGTAKSYQKISQSFGSGPTLDGTNYFGWSVAGIGDLDADRVKDIAVGANYDDDGANNAGAVYVMFMNTNGMVRSYQKISATSGNGPDLDANDNFGSSVAGIGDLNRDWVGDIAAGARYDDEGGGNAGAVYMLILEGTPIPPGTIFIAY